MKPFLYTCILLLPACLLSCADKTDADDGDTVPGHRIVTRMTEPEFVFGFNEHKYSYCPSALLQEDGSVNIFFCGNPVSEIMVDNVFTVKVDPAGNGTEAKSVLQPGESGSWDDHHTCDPSVIEGEFKWGESTYRYAMFFLSNMYGVYYNEIGVAFSNDLNASSWVKYPEQIVRKTWSSEGDQAIGGGGNSWGVGQPSAVSLDKKGKVLLTYTVGDIGGTRIVWTEADMSDVENMTFTPSRTMVATGLYDVTGKNRDYTCNADFAINQEEDKIVMIRPVQPHPTDYPAFIPVAQEIDYMNLSDFMQSRGEWKTIYRITKTDTGFPRNHNSCILRDNFGHIEDWAHPTFYFTVSKAEPEVSPTPATHAEWTYHIYKSTIYETEL